MASIFATTAEVQMFVGANASAVSNVAGHIDTYMSMAESIINAETGVNWSDTYAALNIDKKRILSAAAASWAAMAVINYDLGGIGRSEAQTRLNVLDSIFVKSMRLLADSKSSAARDFVAKNP